MALSAHEHERLKVVAAGQGLSVSQYLLHLIRADDSDWTPVSGRTDESQGDLWVGFQGETPETTATPCQNYLPLWPLNTAVS